MKKDFFELFDDTTAGISRLDTSNYKENGKLAIVDKGKKLVAGFTDGQDLNVCKALPCLVFGDHTKIIKYVDFPFVLGAQGVRVFIPKKDLDPKFAYFMLKNLSFPEGTGYQRHFKYLGRAKFFVPPLGEQRRIAESLSCVDALRQKHAEAQRLVVDLVPAVFEEMFGESKKKSAFGDCIELIDYGTNQKAEYDSGEIPVLRMNNVLESGELDLTDIKKADFTPKELASNLLLVGDLLINRTNSRELVGKVGLWAEPYRAVAASYFIRVRVDEKKLLPKFAHAALNRPEAKQHFRSKANGAVGQANIGMETIKALRIPLPPVALQAVFVKRLEAVRLLAGKIEGRTLELNRLAESMAAGYF